MTSKQPKNTQSTIKHILESTPRYSLFFLLIFAPLARGSVQGWAITVIHIVTLIALAAVLLDKTLHGDWKWLKTPLDTPILVLIVLCIISAFFSVHPRTSFWTVMLLLNYIVIFYLVIHIIDTYAEFKNLVYLLTGVAVFLSLFGMLKLYGLNPFPWWEYPELNKDVPRLSATFGNANHLAGYMEMALLFLSGLILFGFTGIRRPAILSALALLFIALILSISRGGWISLFIGFMFLFLVMFFFRSSRQKWLILPMAAGLLVIALVVLAYTPSIERLGDIEAMHETPNFRARIKVWGGIVEMIKDYPLLGTGPGTFSTVFTQYQPPTTPVRYYYGHNDYLHFISEIGLLLIILMTWMIIALYKTGFRKLTAQNSLDRGVTLGTLAGITAILIHSIVDFNLHIPANAMLFTVLAALAVSPTISNYY